MSAMLDREMPAKNTERKTGFLWLIPLTLIISGLYFIMYNYEKPDNPHSKSKEKDIIIASEEARILTTSDISPDYKSINESVTVSNSDIQQSVITHSHNHEAQKSKFNPELLPSQLTVTAMIEYQPITGIYPAAALSVNENHPDELNNEIQTGIYVMNNQDDSPANIEFIRSEDSEPVQFTDNLKIETLNPLQDLSLTDTKESENALNPTYESLNDKYTGIDNLIPVMVQCCRENKWKVFAEAGLGAKNIRTYSAGIQYQWLKNNKWSLHSYLSGAMITMNLGSSISSKELPETGVSNSSQDIFTLDNNNIPYFDVNITGSKELRLGISVEKSLNQKLYINGGIESVIRNTTVDFSPLRNGTAISSQNYYVGQEISDLSSNAWDVRPAIGLGYNIFSGFSLESRITSGLMPLTKYALNPSDRHFIKLFSLRASYKF